MPVAASQPCGCTGTRVAEEIVDFSTGEEKTLGAYYASEPSLLSLVFSGRSVTLLNEVALTLDYRDGDMFGRI